MRLAHEGALQGHTGTSNTAAYLRERYWWNNLHKDVADFVKKCDICRRARTPQPKRHGLLQQPVRVGDLRLVGIDLFGPLPMGGRNRYLVVYYDPFSHYLLLDAIETKEDVSVLDSFVKTIVLRGFLPAAVTFDNGSEFKNKLFSTFLDQFGIRYSTKIPYQPQTHHTERVNRFIKTMLKSILTGTTVTAWDRFAQYVAYVYNTKCKVANTPFTPHELRFGRPARGPEDLGLQDDASNQVPQSRRDWYQALMKSFSVMEQVVIKAHAVAKRQQKLHYDEHHIDTTFSPGDHVLRYVHKTDNKLRMH